MKVNEIMTKNVDVINSKRSIRDAASLMKKEGFGAIPVESDDRLQGMITDRDITLWLAGSKDKSPDDTPVTECMKEGILYCFEDEDLTSVSMMMAKQQVRRFPVLSRDKKLVGMVSLGDIAKNEESEASSHKALKEISMH